MFLLSFLLTAHICSASGCIGMFRSYSVQILLTVVLFLGEKMVHLGIFAAFYNV